MRHITLLEDAEVEACRLDYLDAITELAPQVLQHLRNVVFPVYQKTGADLLRATPLSEWPPDVRAAVEEWGRRFHLGDEWLLQQAAEELEAVSLKTDPSTVPTTWLVWSVVDKGSLTRLDHLVRPPASDPKVQSKVERRKELQAYEAELEERARAIGLERTKRKRGAPRRHAEWLVEWQVKGDPSWAIKLKHRASISPALIQKAIQTFAEKIKIEIRPAMRGQPRELSGAP